MTTDKESKNAIAKEEAPQDQAAKKGKAKDAPKEEELVSFFVTSLRRPSNQPINF